MDPELESITSDLMKFDWLLVAYIIVAALVVIMAVVCLVMKIIVWVKYRNANKMPISSNLTGIKAAEFVLKKSGHSDIQVIKAGFFREMIFGNYYNIATKKIYLRSVFFKIDDKQSVTSTAIAVQKAAIAKMCEEGDKQAITRNRLHLLGMFGPFLFIPLLLLTVLIDIFAFQTIGFLSIAGMLVSGAFLVMGFIVTFLNIPVEKRANEMALKMMAEYGLATGEELTVMKKVYDAYIISYICDFILTILRIILFILEILIKVRGSSK